MKASKKQKAIRTKKPQPLQGPCGVPPRCSIPIAEVNELIDKAERRIKSKLTIYDDRLAVLNQLRDNEAYIEHLEATLHQEKLSNKTLRSDLAQINLVIKRQLELDEE